MLERALLARKLPRLMGLREARGVRFRCVDLRCGIASNIQANHELLRVCLAALDDCDVSCLPAKTRALQSKPVLTGRVRTGVSWVLGSEVRIFSGQWR